MNCKGIGKGNGCPGVVDVSQLVPLDQKYFAQANAHPCKSCGRLHWPEGEAVVNDRGNPAFLQGKRLVIKMRGSIEKSAA